MGDQTNPEFTAGGSLFNRIAAQWNSYFSAKVDEFNGAATNLALTDPTVNGFPLVPYRVMVYPIGLLNPPVLTDYTQNILNDWTGTVTQNSSSITIEQTSTGGNTQEVVYLSNDSVMWPLATTLNIVMACTMPSGYNSGQPAAGIVVSLNSPTDLTTFFYGTVQSNTETNGLWWLCFTGSGETDTEGTIQPLSVYWIRARFDSGGGNIYVDVSTDGTDNSWSKLVSGVMPSGFAPGTPVYIGWIMKGGNLASGNTSACSIYSLSTSVTP